MEQKENSNKPDDVNLFGEGEVFINQRIYPKSSLSILIRYYSLFDEKIVEITFHYEKGKVTIQK
ncbi:hypothetical protein [Yersinia mollaretii]|uniref:hypothetical protein n=1 Tax=Yersinia mollaretii TaxID=33060 RepID=UPI00156237C6|nr:hypothetical protein [Yersinia mollaretii]QKJ04663.1 hypothetical protein HRD69_17640 [Yersinia mollaretii ATCC 43969]